MTDFPLTLPAPKGTMTDLSPAAKAVLDAYENWSNSMTDHPITPPPELVMKWVSLACEYEGNETWIDLAAQAARWGFDQRTVWDAEWLEVQLQRARDQELEACVEWVEREIGREWGAELRATRRPQPPSLKEQALAELASDGRLTPEQIDAFLAKYTDPADARQFLVEAGLIDKNGELAGPYRPSPMDDLRQASADVSGVELEPGWRQETANKVFDAYNREAKPEPHHQREAIAAALRAAADQMTAYHSKTFLYSIADCLKLNAIADELEGVN